MVGQHLAQYRIEERLGSGGMGAVYKAFDTRLKRRVAVKVLSRSENSLDELKRLLAEARAAAPLNHPAIATIHEVGEAEDVAFIVMELVTGKTLREAFPDGRCEPEALARIGLEVAEALKVAHDHGVVHGDIKPDNLMVGPDERIKILDFGVARRVALSALDETLSVADLHWTSSDKTAGTLAYMAPEQLRGESLDGRADLYSLGVVLYELAAGKRPFVAASPETLIPLVLSATPAPVDALEPEQPAELVSIVGRLLAKDRRERHASAGDLRADLAAFLATRERARAAPSDLRRSVAVLPFPLLAGTAEDGFLSVALAEAVAHGLSQNRQLSVRPTSAVMRYTEQQVNPLEVARELSVQVVVEGSIQRLGPRVRVQVQAWEAARSATLLSVKIDGRMDALFELQDQVADALVDGLGVETGAHAGSEAPTRNPRAYELYLRASERLLRYTDRETRDALKMLESAVKLDPRFAGAWARISAAALNMAVLFDPDSRWYVMAEDSVGRALELDPLNVEAWTARGRLQWSPHHQFENAEALRAFRKTHRPGTRPHDAPLWEGLVFLHIGLHDEARSSLLEALEQQPDDLLAMLGMAELASYTGDHPAAIEYYDRILTQEPYHLYGNIWSPTALVYSGELEKAERGLGAARGLVGEDALLRSGEALLWAKRGEADRAEEMVRRALGDLRSLSHDHHARHYLAAALATIDQPQRALEQLRLASETGLPNYALFREDPHFDPLRERDEFREFMAGLKRAWESYRHEFGSSTGDPP